MRIAYYALHYGKEYLAYSIRSVQDAVDEIHILYTEKPSFGHQSDAVNPDTREELQREAHRFATKPIIWHDGSWWNEGAHRDAIIDIAKQRGATTIATVDADELWDPSTLDACLEYVEKFGGHRGAGRYRAWFIHFWRSLRWVCRDPAMPERFIHVTSFPGTIDYMPREVQTHPVYHFGYAQCEALMRYKWTIHGHQTELRAGWMDQFAKWQPGMLDVHPTNDRGFWNPESTDDATRITVERLLEGHPYRDMAIIR